MTQEEKLRFLLETLEWDVHCIKDFHIKGIKVDMEMPEQVYGDDHIDKDILWNLNSIREFGKAILEQTDMVIEQRKKEGLA